MAIQPGPPSGWQRLFQRIPASRPGGWLFSRTLHYVDRPVLQLTHGKASIASVFTGLPVGLLTTVGARSGERRTTPVLGLEDEDEVILIASYFGRPQHPAWYRNLRAHPDATLSLHGRTRTYIAREADGEEREKYWRKAVDVYPGFDAYQRHAGGRKIPVMVLTPKLA